MLPPLGVEKDLGWNSFCGDFQVPNRLSMFELSLAVFTCLTRGRPSHTRSCRVMVPKCLSHLLSKDVGQI